MDSGPNNSVPTPPLWGGLPATNWVMECWVLPVGTGAPQSRTDSQFMSTGTGHFGGTPGGAAFRSHFTTDGNGNDAIELRAESIGVGAGPIGDPVIIVPDRWTHLAVVNDAGVTTFYVNGVANGARRIRVSPPERGSVHRVGPGHRSPLQRLPRRTPLFHLRARGIYCGRPAAAAAGARIYQQAAIGLRLGWRSGPLRNGDGP